MAVTVVSWNIAKRSKPWRQLLQMDADIALLQEASPPPDDVAPLVDIGPQESWDSHSWNAKEAGYLFDRWPMVVRLSDRVDIEWFRQVGPISEPTKNQIAVSGIGTIAAACVTPRDGAIKPFIAVSMYARWIKWHPRVKALGAVGQPDVSAHRIISDLSAFIGLEHRILAAGDLNILHGFGDGGNLHWEARYRSVFKRMETIGLEFIGPQAPNGRQAEKRPKGEPKDARNVVTHIPGGKKNLEKANNIQLDYVFASGGFHKGISARALNNSVEEWGASDHCRLLIKIAS